MMISERGLDQADLAQQVHAVVERMVVDDIHTHLYDPAFGDLLLWGIDDLLVYHYLVAEAFRHFEMPYEDFWSLPKSVQAERVWQELFIEHSPISESCRGVLTTLRLLGLDPNRRDLPLLRSWFAEWSLESYVTRCMEIAGVRSICMTNSPFDGQERRVWAKGFARDERFFAALRLDPLLLAWPEACRHLQQEGYAVSAELNEGTISGIRRFLEDWTKRIQPKYLMVSLPPGFAHPSGDHSSRILEEAVLPHCRDQGLPFAVMPGVKRAVNPRLQLAGDGMSRTDLTFLENLCAHHPDNRFLATVLARENQHELCVLARKFRNLHIFGCWWFTNIPSVIEEMTRMRLELLGTSFTAQHSDARVLDQILYKWSHSRQCIARVLVEKYQDLAATGWIPSREEMERDVRDLFGGSFSRFLER